MSGPTATRERALPWLALGGTVGAWALVGAAQPTDDGRALCPFRFLTGLDCPFCGSTRAAAALAHGDLVAALDHNAFFVLVIIPVGVLGWALWLRRSSRGEAMPAISDRALRIGLLVVAAWWVLRLAVPWLGSGASG